MDAAEARALARSQLYRLLAAAFRYPEAEDLAALRAGAGAPRPAAADPAGTWGGPAAADAGGARREPAVPSVVGAPVATGPGDAGAATPLRDAAAAGTRAAGPEGAAPASPGAAGGPARSGAGGPVEGDATAAAVGTPVSRAPGAAAEGAGGGSAGLDVPAAPAATVRAAAGPRLADGAPATGPEGAPGAGAADPAFEEAIAAGLGDLQAAAAVTDLETLRARYVATFGHVTVPDCPLYETASEPAEAFAQAQTLADIAGCYRAFGLVPRPGAGERVDHLAVELEFMHYLAYREAYALAHHGPAEVAALREGQRRFLVAHLGRWAPAVARAVAGRAGGVLGAAARVLERFLEAEAAALGEEAPRPAAGTAPPARLAEPHPRQAPPRDLPAEGEP